MYKAITGLLLAASIASVGTVATAEESPTLEKIRAKGEITVGIREGSLGFNYLDDHNETDGYSWQITLRVVDAVREKLGMPDLAVNKLMVSPATRIQLVANQTLDLECSSTTNNTERQKQVSYGNTFYIVGPRLLVEKGSPISNWTDLKDKSVVVNAGTTAEKLLRRMNSDEGWGANILLSKEASQGFMMVETGRADAAMMDDTGLFGLIARSKEPERWEVTGDFLRKEAYGCMLRKDDAGFKAIVDETIAGMMASGEMEELQKKYFQETIAVRGGINLGIPLSDDMKELYKNPNDRPYD
ncbi:transporter substrate-binding domain-containing protein [Nitratireductor sp.]|uniref:transporter substrate-binding domain-containing protein n=1 Tax=Nitratireductor sp. TaxID=1872084 RepID=UPI00262D38D4|nr:transporter substrate-binding domain-containing protein [Nitratireductor sp.]MCV0378343.1 transporter substrate-binding domain-containing protein [Nitratireductor sp.]